MKELLSDRINKLDESETIAMSNRSREMAAKGIDVISLSLGEPDFNTPDFIKEAAHKAIRENYSHYPPVPGYGPVRESISKKFERDNNLFYQPHQIVVSTGAKQSLMNVVLSLVNPGDEIVLPTPYWVSYEAMAQMAEAKTVLIPTSIENDYKVQAHELRSHLTPKSKLLMFSTPCNPSGTVYTQSELESLAQVIEEYPNLYVISDEIYEHINFTGHHFSIGSIKSISDRVITVNGVSKSYAMTGWRIGYIGAPDWIAKAATKMQGQFTSGANGIAQMAAKAALDADPSVTYEMRDKFLHRRDLMIGLLKEIDGFHINKPQGAFYLFPDVSDILGKEFNGVRINTTSDLSMYLLEHAHVATVPGSAFGSPQCLRLSYAASDDVLELALSRISKALS